MANAGAPYPSVYLGYTHKEPILSLSKCVSQVKKGRSFTQGAHLMGSTQKEERVPYPSVYLGYTHKEPILSLSKCVSRIRTRLSLPPVCIS